MNLKEQANNFIKICQCTFKNLILEIKKINPLGDSCHSPDTVKYISYCIFLQCSLMEQHIIAIDWSKSNQQLLSCFIVSLLHFSLNFYPICFWPLKMKHSILYVKLIKIKLFPAAKIAIRENVIIIYYIVLLANWGFFPHPLQFNIYPTPQKFPG